MLLWGGKWVVIFNVDSRWVYLILVGFNEFWWGFLEFCDIYVSSVGIHMAEGVDVFSFTVVSLDRVLLSWKYFMG